MKVTDIPKVLDLALKCRNNGLVYNPLFTGDAGIGKSEICQAWAKAQGEDFKFIDLRLAYLESPDLIGLPHIVDSTTFFATPSMWPKGGRGLLLLEEPNRANPSVLNCLMQLLTDRKINDYTLPEGYIIAGVINPDNANYNVNALDTALKDRFEDYAVLYDKQTFIEFINAKKWDENLIAFIDTVWSYKRPEDLGDKGKYIAPRTYSKLNAAIKSGLGQDMNLHYDTCVAILGLSIGTEFHKYVTEVKPVLIDDLLTNKESSIKKLKKFSKGEYRGDLLSATISNLQENYPTKASLELMLEVLEIIPADLGYEMFKNLMRADEEEEINWKEQLKKYPNIKKQLKQVKKGTKDAA